MKDLQQRIYDITGDLHLMSLATVTEDGLPRVRYVVGKADPTLSIRFSTYLDSAKVRQLRCKPNVSLTTGAIGVSAQTWLEIEGSATVSDAADDRRAFWFDGLSAYFSGVDDPNYGIVTIRPRRIALWSIATRRPEVWHPDS